jgi:hypothetical protein
MISGFGFGIPWPPRSMGRWTFSQATKQQPPFACSLPFHIKPLLILLINLIKHFGMWMNTIFSFMCRNDENVQTTYNLVGLVEHEGDVVEREGDVAGGHYVSYVRGFEIGSSSKSWHKASDINVRKSSLAEVFASKAYLLFYEKVGILHVFFPYTCNTSFWTMSLIIFSGQCSSNFHCGYATPSSRPQ